MPSKKSTRPCYQAYTGERIPTQIRFDNEASETRTLIEIETEDRIGLLYDDFASLQPNSTSTFPPPKFSTEKGAAIDSFYVRELDGGKVARPRAPARHRTQTPPGHP